MAPYSGGLQEGGLRSQYFRKSASERKLNEFGVKLMVRKSKNLAVAAIARKLAVAVWHALKGISSREPCQRGDTQIRAALPLVRGLQGGLCTTILQPAQNETEAEAVAYLKYRKLK